MFRGSSSEQARAYKAEGHANEEEFARLIGGSIEGLPPQGKTDCIGPDGETYSVKKTAKKWQIFLYGIERLISDPGFVKLAKNGLDLSKMLKAFPENYDDYAHDKERAKNAMRSLLASEKSGLNLEALASLLGRSNSYLSSKLKLAQVNTEIVAALQSDEVRELFLRKALFNGYEVGSLAVEDKGKFVVLKSDKVVEIFLKQTRVQLSGTGGHSDDLSIPGQKVIMKAPTNLVELEVRNDSKTHFRQLRFNMNRNLAVLLLRKFSIATQELDSIQFRG